MTPSSRFAAEGEDKRRIIVNYKDTMKSKPCRSVARVCLQIPLLRFIQPVRCLTPLSCCRYFAESRKTHPFCPYGDDWWVSLSTHISRPSYFN